MKFLGFRHAFETLDRQIVWKFKKKYTVGSTVVKWMEGYLSRRAQMTRFGNFLS